MKEVEQKIQLMRETAEKLKEKANNFPALDRNLSRMLATIKMLELNIVT
ncbi:MAG: hypothetical protein K8S13_16275 [Desulfobacula sp.]|nr:hypothetical protein [Desulfobacula sp.]MCD4721395.1 hypothetical protein [Desulfobacula sp.]